MNSNRSGRRTVSSRPWIANHQTSQAPQARKILAVIVHPPVSTVRCSSPCQPQTGRIAPWFFARFGYLALLHPIAVFFTSYPESTPHERTTRKTYSPSRYLRTHIRCQDHVVDRMCSVVTRGELGLQPADQPKGSVFFLGPTGVGKTELTKQIAKFIFGVILHGVLQQGKCRLSAHCGRGLSGNLRV